MSKREERKKLDTSKGGLIWSIAQLVEFALFLTLGVLAIVFSNNSDFQSAIVIAVGVVLIVDGAVKILINFLPILTVAERATYTYQLVITGALELSLGIVLIAEKALAQYLLTTLIYFIGITLIVAGALFLLFAITFMIKKLSKIYLPILEIVLAAVLIAAGIIFIVFYNNNKETMIRVIFIIVGILLILFSIFVLVKMVMAIHAKNIGLKSRDEKKEVTDDSEGGKTDKPIEVEAKDAEVSATGNKEEPKQIEKKPEEVIDIEAKENIAKEEGEESPEEEK